jgi:hypothetical protein
VMESLEAIPFGSESSVRSTKEWPFDAITHRTVLGAAR